MYQPPDNTDFNPFSNKANRDHRLDNLAPEKLEEISPEELAYRKHELGRILMWLMVFGFGLGIIVMIIIAIAMTKLGLTKRPNQIKPIKPQQEQVDKNSIENLDGVEKQ